MCCHTWEAFLISSKHYNQYFFVTSRFMANDVLVYDLQFVNVMTFLIYDIIFINVLIMF